MSDFYETAVSVNDSTGWAEEPLPAFYLRLSKADGDKEESNSIDNQRNILKRHISKMEEFGGSKLVDDVDVRHLEYVDDGYSGKDFNRPGFQKLIADCRKGKVSAILVKDLSRLGRDYIEVNSYLEDIFPFLNVRFITVSEHYDSSAKKEEDLSIEMQFISMMNTFYLKDCAIKAVAGIRAKWKRGELTSVQTPLGYVCRDVKAGWEIDPDGAAIVRTVFDLALTGLGTGEIATEMNRRGILTPFRYLKSKGLWRGAEHMKTEDEKLVWGSHTALNILTNEAYTGTLVQGKTQSVVLGKGISRKASEEMRYRHEGKHEAIVTFDEFETAQNVIKFTGEKTGVPTVHEYTLKGVVRCRNCGRLMSKEPRRFRCYNSLQDEFTGCGGSWLVTEIEEKVRALVIDRSRSAKQLLEEVTFSDYDVAGAKKEIERLKERKFKKYEQYLQKTASREEFMELQAAVGEQIREIEGKIEGAREENSRMMEVTEMLRPLADAGVTAEKNGLTRAMVEELIDCVWVSKEGITADFKADALIKEMSI